VSGPALPAPGRVDQSIQAVADYYGTQLRVTNGYRFDVKYVTRIREDLESLRAHQMPAVLVARPPGQSGQSQHLGIAAYKETIDLFVLGFLRPRSAKNVKDSGFARLSEAFLSDLKRVARKQVAPPPGARRFECPYIHDSFEVDSSNDVTWDAPGAVVGIGLRLIVLTDGENP
jgi:hypothetical protein